MALRHYLCLRNTIDCRCVKQLGEADCWSEESGPEEDGRAEREGWHTEVFDGKIGEESVEVGRTCRTNERGSTTKDGICSPEEGKEKERKTTRWRDCIERDMRKAELEDVDWRVVAQDRGQWRRVVHGAAETCSHPYP